MKTRLISLLTVSLFVPALLLAKPAQQVTLVGVWELAASRTGMQLPPLLVLSLSQNLDANGNVLLSVASELKGTRLETP
jgi:hypothetical protein